MHSLFLKIFLWFWATVIVTGIALVLTFAIQRRDLPARWRTTLVETARYCGTIAIDQTERGGVPAASGYLERIEQETHLRACLFDLKGAVITGKSCAMFADMVARVAASKAPDVLMRRGVSRAAMMLRDSRGGKYIFATELESGPEVLGATNPAGVASEWGIPLLVSGFICYLLTRYLTAPILRLRKASQQLAAGELDTRAAPGMERRRDELGDLVRDFNTMADQIEELFSRERQLISDVSHELRSPLARLNVALDLARERTGNDSAFEHMERDLQSLGETIDRVLTVARLDATSAPVAMSTVNLVELLLHIVNDAQFELQTPNCPVQLLAEGDYFVSGNAELLRSAIENVIRNAVHYTAPGTSVEAQLHRSIDAGVVRAVLRVRDQGPGVPDAELSNIFRPFYHIADARDRQSGGTGLGLAIAERIVRLHGGTICAENVPGGLQIKISLPMADGVSQT